MWNTLICKIKLDISNYDFWGTYFFTWSSKIRNTLTNTTVKQKTITGTVTKYRNAFRFHSG